MLNYRAELDGLRAIAVLAVMGYHADFTWFAGGFVGVDVFLVISGYLIGRILISRLEAGRLDWSEFFERRIRRILPAASFVLAGCLVPAWLLLTPESLADFGLATGASSLFLANIYFWRTHGYFGLAADTQPLVHYWTLSLEEQFYLIFPIALLMIWRLPARMRVPLLAVTATISLGLWTYGGALAPTAQFFLLPTRAWEFLIGALLASREIFGKAGRYAGPAAGTLAMLGLVLILWSIFAWDYLTGPTWPLIVPAVVGTALIIANAAPGTAVSAFLSIRPLVIVGLISFSAYLWHQPLLAFTRLALPDAPTLLEKITVLGAALVLAGVTWKLVEQPLRRKRDQSRFAIFAAAGLASLGLAVAGALLWLNDGFPLRFDTQELALVTLNERRVAAMQPCLTDPNRTEIAPQLCLAGGRAAPKRVAFMGDSHVVAVSHGFTEALNIRGIGSAYYVEWGCPPVLDEKALDPVWKWCAAANRRALRRIIADSQMDTVVIGARWPHYFESARYNNGVGGIDQNFSASEISAKRRQRLATAVKEPVRRFLAAGKHVILVYPVPEPGWTVPIHILRSRALNRVPKSIPLPSYLSRSASARRALDAIGSHSRLTRVHPAARLCDATSQTCPIIVGEQPLYADSDHLTEVGAHIAISTSQVLGALGEDNERRSASLPSTNGGR